ncbi:MAG: hypothetical protein JWM99_2602 [Verrucomicrobiales bacterium]|jgi:hypothetical protein|nr:hypothetical protein [Verrucomicrobiales bacterium]
MCMFCLALITMLPAALLNIQLIGAETNELTNGISTTLTNLPAVSTGTNSDDIANVVIKEPARESAAEKTNEFAGQDLASFKIIADRNIFNANRSPRSSGRSPVREIPKPIKIDSFSLVGTLSSDKGQFAFFDGSSSDFQKVLKVDDSIGGLKIAQIDTSAVKFESKGKGIDLKMGAQMRRQDQGEWQISDQTDSYSSGASATTNNNKNEPSSGAESDILKRLMQQREQEMNK